MYGVVLMMALNQGANVADLGHRGGHGCHGGCYGGCSGGCYGGGYGGCYGGGYGGCYGGGWGGGYGGCYGGGWGGCSGSGFGYGGFSSCYGGGYGSSFGGCSGSSFGGGYGSSFGGCYGGGFGAIGNVGGMGAIGGGIMTPIQGGTIQGGEPLHQPKDGKRSEAPAPATIIVSLPEDASLTVDDVPTTSTSGSRTFVSPELQQGKDYHYNLKATVQRDGKAVVVEKRVTVHAGETTPVSLTLPEAGVAQR